MRRFLPVTRILLLISDARHDQALVISKNSVENLLWFLEAPLLLLERVVLEEESMDPRRTVVRQE